MGGEMTVGTRNRKLLGAVVAVLLTLMVAAGLIASAGTAAAQLCRRTRARNTGADIPS